MSFDSKPFTELLSAIIDNRGKTCPVCDAGVPLIATNCIDRSNLYPSYNTTRYVSQEVYDNWFRGHPLPGDILFVCKGSPGRTNWVPDPVDFCIAQDMVAVRADPEKIYPKYLFAALRSSIVQDQINSLHVGTMIPHFKKGDFDKLNIPMVADHDQKSIGDFYFMLSERVNLLRETNVTLESVAQALFKSWFIDFDPVRAKQAGRLPECIDSETAALFPNDFDESELGLVPTGWQVVSLGESASYLTRGISPRYLEEGGVLVINQKCIRDNVVDFSKARRHDHVHRNMVGRELIVGDILVNSTGVGTLGRVAQILALGEVTIVDSHVTIVRAGPNVTWNYLGLSMMRRQTEIENMGEGTTGQTELSRGNFSSLKLAVPPIAVLEAFDDLSLPLRARFSVNLKQAQTLTRLRDNLLPRLISGQLRLPQAEEEFSEALTGT